jgi:hypothetical protein
MSSAGSAQAPPAGLCNSCVNQRVVRTTRGSVFSLCQRSKAEPDRFPRYPRLPVTACVGYRRGVGETALAEDDGSGE